MQMWMLKQIWPNQQCQIGATDHDTVVQTSHSASCRFLRSCRLMELNSTHTLAERTQAGCDEGQKVSKSAMTFSAKMQLRQVMFGETDQSQVAQPELLLTILLPVAQQVISPLTCTSITTYLSHCVLHVFPSCINLLLAAQHGLSSWVKLRLSFKIAARHSAACYPEGHSLLDLHKHHCMSESACIRYLVTMYCSAACCPSWLVIMD